MRLRPTQPTSTLAPFTRPPALPPILSQVVPGDIFVQHPWLLGEDDTAAIMVAVEKGAAVVVAPQLPTDEEGNTPLDPLEDLLPDGVPLVRMEDTMEAGSRLGAAFYGEDAGCKEGEGVVRSVQGGVWERVWKAGRRGTGRVFTVGMAGRLSGLGNLAVLVYLWGWRWPHGRRQEACCGCGNGGGRCSGGRCCRFCSSDGSSCTDGGGTQLWEAATWRRGNKGH